MQYIMLLLEKFLRHVRTLCVALHIARNSPIHSNAVINNAIVIRLLCLIMVCPQYHYSRINAETEWVGGKEIGMSAALWVCHI